MRNTGPIMDADLEKIRKNLGHYTGEKTVKLWLDTKCPELHSVLGSPTKGIPYGKMTEIAGPESHGKTFLQLELARYAQRDGAQLVWLDYESCFDKRWARKRGVDTDKLVLIEPYMMTTKKGADEMLSGAEHLMEEAKEVIKYKKRQGCDRFYLGLDSLASMVTSRAMEAGESDANMNTNTDLSRFLSRIMPQWAGLIATHNVMMVCTNQLRTRPGVAFGNPEYTPGGKAVAYYCAIRVKIRRGSNRGKMIQAGAQIGVKGTIENYKNKAGAGSLENAKIGFKFFYKGAAKFVSVAEAKSTREESED